MPGLAIQHTVLGQVKGMIEVIQITAGFIHDGFIQGHGVRRQRPGRNPQQTNSSISASAGCIRFQPSGDFALFMALKRKRSLDV